ncbi:MAG TPA: alcohol dehydrogenase [Candidatus Eisenbacteria bacterium]|nr:alcohol dehydrogenase [Candidatus Eisenbacteria bacterium]
MAKNLVAQVGKAGGPFELVERELPTPKAGEIRIKVLACGVCHSDAVTKEGLFPNISYPRVPGHEVAGIVDEVGSGVTEWKKGDRVGAGWHGGHCFVCEPCRRGDFITCKNEQIHGVTVDGGYGQYMIARHEAVARMPESMNAVEAGPLLCAGITTFNALRNSIAGPGDLVAVQGIGGLGHLGIQFGAKFGYRVVGIGRGPENGVLAKKLGASAYIDSKSSNAAEELQKMGGANVILATAPSAKAMSELLGGLKPGGELLTIGVSGEPLEVPLVPLIVGKRRVQGWPSGTAMDSEDTLQFAELTGVKAMIEKYPLAKVNEAYERMMSGKAEFRVVLTME